LRLIIRVKEGKFSKSPGYIRKIPINPPLQKGEAVGMPELIEKLPKKFGYAPDMDNIDMMGLQKG